MQEAVVKPMSQTFAHATAFHSSKCDTSKAHHQRRGILTHTNAVHCICESAKWVACSSTGVNTGMAACSKKRQALERSTGKVGNDLGSNSLVQVAAAHCSSISASPTVLSYRQKYCFVSLNTPRVNPQRERLKEEMIRKQEEGASNTH